MTENDRRHDVERRLRELSLAGVEPERDLWPGIESEIRASRLAAGTARRWLVAAAGIVLVAAAVLTFRGGGSESLEFDPPAARALPASSSPYLVEVFDDYDRSRAELRRALERKLADYPEELTPPLAAAIETNLAVIDEAMANIERALADLPRDEELERSLVALYEHELRLLEELSARLAGSNVAS